MTRIDGWAAVGLCALLLGGGACAQTGARDKSTSEADASDKSAGDKDTSQAAAAPEQGAAADRTSEEPRTGEITGRVERVDRDNNLTVAGSESAGLAFDQFKVDSSTEVTIGGEKASIDEVNPGDQVRASFSGTGDKLHVDRLQVLPSEGAPEAEGMGSGSEEKDNPGSSPDPDDKKP